MKTLDKTQKVTEVGGRAPLRYLQDGYGFDAAGKCLGKFTDSGEAMESEPKASPVSSASAPSTPYPAPADDKPRRGRKPKAADDKPQDEAGA